MTTPKYCPIISDQTNGLYDCIKDLCEWWIEEEKACARKVIAWSVASLSVIAHQTSRKEL